MTRPLEFAAGSYKFKYGATLQDEFDLKAKLDEIEGDIDDLEADQSSANNAQAIADEAVARASADTALQNSLTAEISRATTAEQANVALHDKHMKVSNSNVVLIMLDPIM